MSWVEPGKLQMIMECPVVPESKEVLKKKGECMLKITQGILKKFPMARVGTILVTKWTIGLDYNSKSKINIHKWNKYMTEWINKRGERGNSSYRRISTNIKGMKEVESHH